MQFSLATTRHNGLPTPVIEVSNKYYSLTEVAPDLLGHARRPGLMGLFDDWKRAESRLSELAGEISKSGAGLLSPQPRPDDFMTPLQFPSKLLLGGANYYEHMIKEAKIPNFRKEDGTLSSFSSRRQQAWSGAEKPSAIPYNRASSTGKSNWPSS